MKNITNSIFANITEALCQFLIIIYIVNILGLNSLGIFTLIVAFVAPFYMFFSMKFETAFFSEPSKNIYDEFIVARFLFGITAFLVSFVLFFFFYRENFLIFFLISLYKLIDFYSEFLFYFFIYNKQKNNFFFFKSFYYLTSVFFIFLSYFFINDFINFLLILLILKISVSFYISFLTLKNLVIKKNFLQKSINLLYNYWSLGLLGFIISLNFSLSRIIGKNFLTLEDLGILGILFYFFYIFTIINKSIFQINLREISQQSFNSLFNNPNLKNTLAVSLLIQLIAFTILILFKEYIFEIFFNIKNFNYNFELYIIFLSAITMSLFSFINLIIVANKRNNFLIVKFIIFLPLIFFLNYFLIKYFNIFGAALSLLVGSFYFVIISIIELMFIKK